MFTKLRHLVATGLVLLPLAAASLQAQTLAPGDTIVTSPVAEGSVIKNVASATFTDANGNPYTPVKDSVSITVGFLGAPNPTGQASYSPKSPSSGNLAEFTLTNSGNGTDSARVSALTLGTGLTFTKFTYNGVDYADLAALNAVISLVQLAPGASLPYPVVVVYSVAGNIGAQTPLITLTQQSVRTASKTARWRTTISPPAFDSVTVSPKGISVARVATNLTVPVPVEYTQTFTVTNRGNRVNSFGLAAAVAAPANGTVTITNVSATTSGALAVNAPFTVTVTYRVFEGTAPDQITLTATGANSLPASDVGDVTVSVSKASLSFSKTAWTLPSMTLPSKAITPTDSVVPGDTLYYRLAVTNAAGSADAKTVVLTDAMSASLTFLSATGDTPANWTITSTTVAGATTVKATLSSTIVGGGPARFIWIAAKVNTVVTPPAP